jgi:DNA-binding CsgD family transcriptional regulator
MRYIGIIEQNKTVVRSIIDFFLSREGFPILFICKSLNEYKSLPIHHRKKADILFVEAGQNYFDHFQQIKYLKSINMFYQIVLLYKPPMLRPGAISFMDTQHLEPGLEINFGIGINAQLKQDEQHIAINGHQPQQAEQPLSSFLTTRETEIVELVIRGLTNRQVADTLYISTYTVNAHLRKVFSKLSIKCRTELVFKMINL